MFIESLKVSYPSEGWSLEETKFDRFNLLVGASGVGKTKILAAIDSLCHFATELNSLTRFPHASMTWEIRFNAKNGGKFLWAGEIGSGNTKQRGAAEGGEDSYFLSESIWKDDEAIAQREGGEVFFAGNKMPKVHNQQSLIAIFGEDEKLSEGFQALRKVVNANESSLAPVPLGDTFEMAFDGMNVDLEGFRNSSAPVCLKLYWLFHSDVGKPLFEKIEDAFKDIFPFVKFLSPEMVVRDGKPYADIFLGENWQDARQRISLEFFSSGMKKTLEFLAQIELSADNSLILIDEFENSLGANCISSVTDAIQYAKRGLQFIITSHHPYIINNVDFKHWKIVTRNAGKVVAKPALEFGLGRSRHQNFFQLINLEAFQTGVLEEAG